MKSLGEHANTTLRDVLTKRLGMAPEDAAFWDDVTSILDDEDRLPEVQAWIERFPAASAKDWFLLSLEVSAAQQWEAAGFTPAQVGEALDLLYAGCTASGTSLLETLSREQAWRESGLGPAEVLPRLRQGQAYPA
jgi:hypothetical protein